ncbi:hypothetical protein NAT51_04215 [Flavobacterium amniphilum]|uniref:hypothetical protein n=1 Tax=Flavobacterium amniphilum TaxID=1834035 RepID=UPI00202A8CF8|nr:hypothetical protein [Flavobacterium amniphilum]MCL9804713.1 hypothetical protein [Flavobacterium amniphilum]
MNLKNNLLAACLVLVTLALKAQVGIGTTTPDPSAILHLESNSKGLLLPRIALTSKTDAATIASPVAGLLVYNTGLGGLSPEGLYQWKSGNWNLILDSTAPLAGDVTGGIGTSVVSKLQNLPVSSAAPTINQVLRYNGTQWEPSNDVSSQNWLLVGNVGTNPTTNFLGTTDDVKMQLRSNNQNVLEFGNRNTLGLVQAVTDYTNPTQRVTYLKSALQFEAAGASFYKPMFFVDADGNFKLKGSAAGTDFFSLGSAGTSGNGSLEFQIGDDGNEPIVFKKYNYTSGAYIEMMRMQGTGLDATVRVGVNTSGTVANSTLQVVGSQSNSVTTFSTANPALNDTHYTAVLAAGVSGTLSLPTASTCTGRIYCIRNTSGGAVTTSSYRNMSNTAVTSIANSTVIQLQSDGTNWLQIR